MVEDSSAPESPDSLKTSARPAVNSIRRLTETR